jgi:hypothetical protein
MIALDEFLPQLLADDPYGLTPAFRQWLASRRFRTFAENYQTKIRAKLRTASDEEALQDLLFELTIARWLLQEKRLHVAYEPQPVRSAPGPDFTVTFTTKTIFHVEVTRIRPPAPTEHATASSLMLDPHKLLHVILGKLTQIKPGAANVLLIGLPSDAVTDINLDELTKQMKQRITSNDTTFLARSRLRTPGEFFKQYHALSGILLYGVAPTTLGVATAPTPLLWLNKEARYPLVAQVQTCLRQLPPLE